MQKLDKKIDDEGSSSQRQRQELQQVNAKVDYRLKQISGQIMAQMETMQEDQN